MDGEIRDNALLAVLPDAERARWLSHLEPVELPLGAVLYEAGNRLTHVYFPTTSLISLLTVLRDHDPVEAATVGRWTA